MVKSCLVFSRSRIDNYNIYESSEPIKSMSEPGLRIASMQQHLPASGFVCCKKTLHAHFETADAWLTYIYLVANMKTYSLVTICAVPTQHDMKKTHFSKILQTWNIIYSAPATQCDRLLAIVSLQQLMVRIQLPSFSL